MSGSESETDLSKPVSDASSVKSTDSSLSNTPKIPMSAPDPPATAKVIMAEEGNETEPTPSENDQQQHVTFIYKNDIETRQEVTLPMNTTVKSVKVELAKILKLQVKNIRLVKNGEKMQNGDIVTGLPKCKVEQELNMSAGSEAITIEIGLNESDSESEGEPDEPTDVLQSLTILAIKDAEKLTEVSVVKTMSSRQFLGGYKNKKTGIIYYHAASQTEYKNARMFSSRVPSVELNTRQTQTLLPLVEEGVNTTSEKCTQMAHKEIYIPEITDRIVTVGAYQPYEEEHKLMTPEAAARILQKAWKFFIRKKRLQKNYQSQADDRAAKKQYKGSSLADFHKLQLSLLSKDSFPSTRGDFYNLYTKVGEWKTNKVAKLKEEKSGFAYKVAAADLQKKEVQGLLAIEEQRVRARNENLNRQDILFLEGTARSRVRQYPKGNVTIIDDLNTQRARNFKEQFASYTRRDVSNAERIEILSCMRSFLAEFEAVDLTGDLIELLDREMDMINMGIEDKHLSILRKRFESLYINLAKNPEFNPKAMSYNSSQSTKKYAAYRCVSCGKVLHPSHMFMHLRLSRFRTCMSCNYMHTTATATTNLAPYKRILTSLRAAEQQKCCRSAIAFLLQPMGMYFLVNILWNGRSVISGSSYLPGLKVTRWLPNEEWSMWNMILLTELEAHKHDTLANPLEHYSSDFILNVANRNILGRIHFRSVADIDAKFREREGVLPKDYLLFNRRKDELLLPKNELHPCLTPQSAIYESEGVAKKDASN